MNDNKANGRPWWERMSVTLIKELGSLSLVVLMLVGIYILSDNYLSEQTAMFRQISNSTQISVELEQEMTKSLRYLITVETEINILRERLGALEKQVKEQAKKNEQSRSN